MALSLTKPTHDCVLLVTFGPKNFKSFKAHSLQLIELQAKAMNIPHILIEIGEEGKTHLECYREKIAEIKQQYNLDLLVTGTTQISQLLKKKVAWLTNLFLLTSIPPISHLSLDCSTHSIGLSDNNQIGDILNVCDNFMTRATQDIIELSCPIWAIDRHKLLDGLFERQFELLITCASIKKLGDDEELTRQFVGARLTKEFQESTLQPREKEVDMGGELGEFHTMVLAAPELYNGYKIEFEGRQIVEGEYMYMEFDSLRLVHKDE